MIDRLQHITIASKLRLLVFASLFASIGIGIFGLYQLFRVDLASNEIRSNWMPSIQYLAEANAALANHRMKTYKHITLTELTKMDAEEIEMAKLLKEAEDNIEKYSELTFSEFEQKKVAQVTQHLSVYKDINQSIVLISRKNFYDSVRSIIYTTSFEQYTFVNKSIKELLAFNIQQSQITSGQSESIFKNAVFFISISLLCVTILIIYFGRVIIGDIRQQLAYLQGIFKKLAVGNVNVVLKINSTDEIGQLSKDIAQVIDQSKKAANFSTAIGEGNLDASLTVLGEEDALGISLSNMQAKLRQVAEDDRRRNWASEGLTQMAEILRTQYDDQRTLFDKLIAFAVNYSDSIQGGLFLADEEKSQKLELAACYAYNRKKFIEKNILPGEGLVGQVFLEQKTRYLTDVPNDYVSITSGLGDANPTSILIVPLKLDSKAVGVMELASFGKKQKYQIEFVEKLAHSIASAIVSVRSNDNMKKLLQTSLQQAEEMRAQEEEVRQNMEELTATQEEMNRKSLEYESRFEAINDSKIGTVEFDLQGNILNANKAFLNMMGYHSIDEIAGKHHRQFVDKRFSHSQEYIEFWKNMIGGSTKSGEFAYIRKDGTPVTIHCHYHLVSYVRGVPIKIMNVALDLAYFSNRGKEVFIY